MALADVLPNRSEAVKYSCEFWGTFVLTFFVAWSLGYARTPFAPLIGGFLLCSIIYAIGPKSGGHVNPALTLTLYMADPESLGRKNLFYYMFFQVLGGVCGAFMKAKSVEMNPTAFHVAFVNNKSGNVELANAFGAEALGVAFFFWLIIQIAADTSNMYYGLGIGLANTAAVAILAPISGAGLNPAVVFANNLVADHYGTNVQVPKAGLTLTCTPVYIVAELLGGLLALVLLKLTTEPPVREDEKDVEAVMMSRSKSLLASVHMGCMDEDDDFGGRRRRSRRPSMLLPIGGCGECMPLLSSEEESCYNEGKDSNGSRSGSRGRSPAQETSSRSASASRQGKSPRDAPDVEKEATKG